MKTTFKGFGQAFTGVLFLLLAPAVYGDGFDVELTVDSVLTYGGQSGPATQYQFRITEGSRVLGAGNWFDKKAAADGFVYLESQLPVTVRVHTNTGFTDGYMTYRDMKRDFNQGSDHCHQETHLNPFAFQHVTTCHFDHE